MKDKHRKAIFDILTANPRVERVVLFGSRAMGTFTTTSDVDLALFGDELTLTDQARLAAAIDKLPMAQQVDLLLYKSIDNDKLKQHIKKHGKEWFRRGRVMSADWPLVELSELVKDLTVGFVGSMTQEYVEKGVPFFRSKNIKPYDLEWADIKYVSRQFHEKLKKSSLAPGDVVIVRTGTPGTACVIPESVEEANCSDVVIARVNDKKLSAYYLSYFMNSVAVHQVSSHLVGAVQQHFNVGSAKKIKIPLPSRDEQEEIVTVLKTLDDKLKLNRQINQTLEEMAQAIFKSWFVDFEPVKAKIEAKVSGQDPQRAAMCAISGKTAAELDQLPPDQLNQLRNTAALFPDELTDSELGLIPKGWDYMQFGDVVEIFDSKRVPLSKGQREARKGPYPYYGAASVMDYVDDYLFDGTYVLMAEDGSVIDGNGYPTIQYVWGKFWVNNHAHILKGANGVSDENILLYLKSTVVAPYVTGAVQLKINQKNMKMIPFLKASEALHQSFGNAIKPLFEGIKNGINENLSLTELRDVLLPRLLSGSLEIKG
ncbi:restriction endonuclease subunit S [Desulfobacter sp. UBA2225]|uniref:restriction endonuclease subunit S n=1 Tax=Desulfobacter sp. UBA2225 TaxID=1961413 RepID=UPI0025808F12|nr:restriction endonuclease subunit S [Desulfobacter sp. UBA2225]